MRAVTISPCLLLCSSRLAGGNTWGDLFSGRCDFAWPSVLGPLSVLSLQVQHCFPVCPIWYPGRLAWIHWECSLCVFPPARNTGCTAWVHWQPTVTFGSLEFVAGCPEMWVAPHLRLMCYLRRLPALRDSCSLYFFWLSLGVTLYHGCSFFTLFSDIFLSMVKL